jgi:hypothetical protein
VSSHRKPASDYTPRHPAVRVAGMAGGWLCSLCSTLSASNPGPPFHPFGCHPRRIYRPKGPQPFATISGGPGQSEILTYLPMSPAQLVWSGPFGTISPLGAGRNSGGILLGLTFGDWRRVALLGLAAMVGFGVGGAIATALRMPMLAGLTFEWEQPPLLVLYVLVQGMVGLIGGALLGAALGYLERRKLAQGQRPRVR